jgi:hypothetical protein
MSAGTKPLIQTNEANSYGRARLRPNRGLPADLGKLMNHRVVNGMNDLLDGPGRR